MLYNYVTVVDIKSFGLLDPKNFKLFGFQFFDIFKLFFWLWAYMMKVILEAYRTFLLLSLGRYHCWWTKTL